LTTNVEDAVIDTMGRAFKPRTIQWVADLPRTRSAKIMRRVVKAVALGRETGDISSLENPESLDSINPL
jgi:acetyl-CoA synthetase